MKEWEQMGWFHRWAFMSGVVSAVAGIGWALSAIHPGLLLTWFGLTMAGAAVVYEG